MSTSVRPHGLLRACFALCLLAPAGCEPPEGYEDAAEAESDGEDEDLVEFRWNTPLLDHRTLVTSMKTDNHGNNGGCWDTSPSGGVRPFQQYSCHAGNNQLWLFRSAPGGGFTIHSRDDDDLCLDVPSNNFVPGQDLQMYPCHGGANQVWNVFVRDGESATIRPRGHNDLCLDVEGAVVTNQAPIQLFGCHGGDNQAWRFHDYLGSDDASCDWAMKFGSYTVGPGERRSFGVSNNNTFCSESLQPGSLSCPDDTDWLVVDSPFGSDDFHIKCFSEG